MLDSTLNTDVNLEVSKNLSLEDATVTKYMSITLEERSRASLGLNSRGVEGSVGQLGSPGNI